ncbi:MAG: class I SAM-dependent methyltransferase [Deltaproteobacteria bacterium]|nr:class I SAM-dependent methyltransferase [Deltaproteobacteria bacterium]
MPLNWVAPVYDWYCAKVGLGKKFRQRTLELAGVREGERVLDAGCGTGVLTRMAAALTGPSGYVAGIDPAPRMIGVARSNASAEGSRAEFRLGVIEELPFPDNSFDCVLSSFMAHHLPPEVKLKGFGEVYRVLRPGGRFLVVDIGRPSNPLWWAAVFPLLFWSFTKDQIRGRLNGYFLESGFPEVEQKGWWMGLINFWLARK